MGDDDLEYADECCAVGFRKGGEELCLRVG
jgi:hypothetical protein